MFERHGGSKQNKNYAELSEGLGNNYSTAKTDLLTIPVGDPATSFITVENNGLLYIYAIFSQDPWTQYEVTINDVPRYKKASQNTQSRNQLHDAYSIYVQKGDVVKIMHNKIELDVDIYYR